MKTILSSVALSLCLGACLADPAVDAEEATSSVATQELGAEGPPVSSHFGATTQSCVNWIWVCEPNCPFFGGQNILMAICNGVETRVHEMPCSFEGCF